MNKLHLLTFCLLALPLTGTAQKNSTYTGPSISLNENKMTVTSVGKLERTAKTSFQGMDICGDWLISLEHSGIATVYQTDGKSLSRKGHLTLGSSHRSNHCNSANFSNHKVEAGDPLPLLYVSRCNTVKMADGTDRMVFVERIDPINMKSELVQRVVLQSSQEHGQAIPHGPSTRTMISCTASPTPSATRERATATSCRNSACQPIRARRTASSSLLRLMHWKNTIWRITTTSLSRPSCRDSPSRTACCSSPRV